MFPSFAELTGGKSQPIFQMEKLNLADKEAAKLYIKQYTKDVCNYLSQFSLGPFGRLNCIYNVFDLHIVIFNV